MGFTCERLCIIVETSWLLGYLHSWSSGKRNYGICVKKFVIVWVLAVRGHIDCVKPFSYKQNILAPFSNFTYMLTRTNFDLNLFVLLHWLTKPLLFPIHRFRSNEKILCLTLFEKMNLLHLIKNRLSKSFMMTKNVFASMWSWPKGVRSAISTRKHTNGSIYLKKKTARRCSHSSSDVLLVGEKSNKKRNIIFYK